MLMLYRKNLNEVINTLNQMSEIVDNIDTNFTDIYERIDNINLQIDEINQNFVTFENNINRNVALQLQQFNNQIVQLMNDYQNIFNKNLLSLRNDIEKQIENIELGNVIAYDPTTRNL